MEITKEQLDQLQKDKFFHNMCGMIGIDLDEIIAQAKKELQEKEDKKKYEVPKCEKQKFLMNEKQFEEFCKAYTELVEAEKKLSYIFGVEFNEGGSGFGFSTNARAIIWNLIRIIFGDDNAEDIADFLYGNSNFDNTKSLYDELI